MDLAKDAKINSNTILIDEPWRDLPFETKYHPYLSSDKPEKEPEADRPRAIWISTHDKPQDIAQLPYSISYRIAKHEARVVRLYTLPEQRRQLADSIADRRPNLRNLLWYDKMINHESLGRWNDWVNLNNL